MIRLATWPVANRIIGRPSRRLASFGGGLPMMRLSQQTVVYRIIGMPSAIQNRRGHQKPKKSQKKLAKAQTKNAADAKNPRKAR